MTMMPRTDAVQDRAAPAPNLYVSTFPIVLALSFAHMLNDMMQSLLPAIYPLIKESYHLDFRQIGIITLAFQLTASVLQPVVGYYTDLKPQPYSLSAAMGLTLVGLLLLSGAASYGLLLVGAVLIGTGSSIFHPESTRMARFASGGRHGFAQSLFQVGGQTGQSLGPLLAAFIVVPRGQASLAWFSGVALIAIAVLVYCSRWYAAQPRPMPRRDAKAAGGPIIASRAVGMALVVLIILMWSKAAYTSSLSTYHTFFVIEKFGVSIQSSQVLLFLFLVSQAVGSLLGGYIGDRFGRRQIIWFSILGAMPLTLLLPYAGFWMTAVLTVLIGMVMASAFPAILVYGMELLPGRVGLIAGTFYGMTFGLGALSAAGLGVLADYTSLDFVYKLCAWLPAIGALAWFLPDPAKIREV